MQVGLRLHGGGEGARASKLAQTVKKTAHRKPEEDTPVDAFITALKKVPYLHFAPLPEESDKK